MRIISLPLWLDNRLKQIADSAEELTKLRLYCDAVSYPYDIDNDTYHDRQGWNSVYSKALRNSIGKDYTEVREKLEAYGLIEVLRDSKDRIEYSKARNQSSRQRIADWRSDKWIYRTILKAYRRTSFRGAKPELRQGYKDASVHFKNIGIDAEALLHIYDLLQADNKYVRYNRDLLQSLCDEANTGIKDVDKWLRKLEQAISYPEEAVRLSERHQAINKELIKENKRSERYYTIWRARSATMAVITLLFSGVRVTNYTQKGDRMGSNISNLPSYLKQYVRFSSGRYVYEVDIPNSQVGFSWLLVLENMRDCPEKYRYLQAISDSDIYDLIAEDNDISRKDAKDAFFLFFFGKPFPYWRYRNLPASKTFRRLFPKIYDFFTDLKKREGYQQLAIQSQILEAQFLYTEVVPLMKDTGYQYYTTHDSVTFSCNTKEEAETINKRITQLYLHRTGIVKDSRLTLIADQRGPEQTYISIC